jgi:hypothetical protein
MRVHFFLRLATIGFALTAPSFAAIVYDSGTGVAVFGVAPYNGAPNVGGPTYIANNFTGRNDILTSPGLGTLGGYLTASPIIANNIANFGPAALTVSGSQTGGGNGNGAFGSGLAVETGPTIGFDLADSGPGGGSASYLIGAEDFTYTNMGALIPAGTTYGAYIGIGGVVPLVGNADVASLIVKVSDTAGVFGVNGTVLPQMVLAISRNGAGSGIGNYNIVVIGGGAGGNAALILDNGVNGAFRALAVDNAALPADIPVGDVITVLATLTAFSDPASFDTILPGLDLLDLTGPLPTLGLVSTVTTTPEPSPFLLLAGGLFTLGILQVRRRVASRR